MQAQRHMEPPSDGYNGITPERLKSLLDELNEVTTEAAHLCERIESSIAQIHTDRAVDDAARLSGDVGAPVDGDEPGK